MMATERMKSLAACVVLTGFQSLAAAIHVAPSGSDSYDGLSWATAKKTIAAGVAAALGGGDERVVVSNGIYSISATIAVTGALRVEAFDTDPEKTIIRRSSGGIRIWNLSHPQAVVHGFTLENGALDGSGALVSDGILSGCVVRNGSVSLKGGGIWMTGGIVTNCVVSNCVVSAHNSAVGGGGVYMEGGLLVDSVIRDNRPATRGGGGVYASGGLIDRCRVLGNLGVAAGGGVHLTGGAELRNSLVAGNRSYREAGGAYVHQGRVVNCTISRNQGYGENGGLQLAANGQAVNCIVWGNSGASFERRNFTTAGGLVSNCCVQPPPAGAGNIGVDPEFYAADAGDFRLRPGSPAADAGLLLDGMTAARDLDGAPRVSGLNPDLGAYESPAVGEGILRVAFTTDVRRVNAPATVVFTACVEGENRDGLTYWWNMGNGTSTGADLAQVTHHYSSPGIYTISLTVSNSAAMGATCIRERHVVVGPLEWHVSPEGSSTAPYSDWSTAITDLHWAFANAGSNDTIHLAGRDFNLTETLPVTCSDVTVKGGYAADGGAPGGRDPVRMPTRLTRDSNLPCLRLMTIEDAARMTFEDLVVAGGRSYDGRGNVPGCGIHLQRAADIRFVRCRVVGNDSVGYGGGIYSSGSTADFLGGEISLNRLHGDLWDQSLRGGGVYLADGAWNFRNVRFGGNNTDRVRIASARNNNRENLLGGGIFAANGTHTISNCVFYGNNGSRPYNSTAVNHDREGGGLYINGGSTTVELSTFVHNSSEGVRRNGGTLALRNSILWDNGGNDVVGSASVSACCVESGDFAGSNDNISADPRFTRGLYLGDNSLCRDAGSGTAEACGMSALTTRTNGVPDAGIVDLGFHYEEGLSSAWSDLYVAEDGDDSQAGHSPAEPFRTVTRALALARDGTHIHVGKGTFNDAGGEAFPLVMCRPGLHLSGAGMEQSTLDAASLDQVVTIKGIPVDGRLKGFTITGGSVYRNYGGGIGIWQSRVTLQECRIVENTLLRPSNALNWGSEYGAGIGSCLATVTMRDCAVVSNTVNCSAWDGAALGGGIGIREGAWSVERSVVAFNQAAGNSRSYNFGAGLLIDGGSHCFKNLLLVSNRCNKVGSQYIRAFTGDGAYLLNGASVVFENATVAQNEGQGVFCENTGTYPPAACTFTNGIAWGNGVDVLGKDTANQPMPIAYTIGLTGAVSVAWSDCQEAHDGEGNQTADPLFAAPGDYHVHSRMGRWTPTGHVRDAMHSPCIDAGWRRTPVGGEPVPNGNRINLGAFGGTAQASLSRIPGSVMMLR